MAAVPATDYGKDTGRLKYTTEHVQIIERHSRQTGKLGMDILIDEWGTSGRVRPTCEVKGLVFVYNYFLTSVFAYCKHSQPELQRRFKESNIEGKG